MIDRDDFKEVFDATDEEFERFIQLASPDEYDDDYGEIVDLDEPIDLDRVTTEEAVEPGPESTALDGIEREGRVPLDHWFRLQLSRIRKLVRKYSTSLGLWSFISIVVFILTESILLWLLILVVIHGYDLYKRGDCS